MLLISLIKDHYFTLLRSSPVYVYNMEFKCWIGHCSLFQLQSLCYLNKSGMCILRIAITGSVGAGSNLGKVTLNC